MIGLMYCAIVFLLYFIYEYYSNVRRYPRGPTPLPFIGNLFQFVPNKLHYFLEESQKQYGDVFTVWLPLPMVVIMSHESIKEALVTNGDDFLGRSGRYPDTVFQTTPNGGVIFSEGPVWREQRRAAITIMRDFGMGKNLMEGQVRESMLDFMDHLESLPDKDRVDFRWPIQILVANVINNVLFGYHYKFSDCDRLMQFSNKLNDMLTHMRTNPILFLAMKFPFVEKIPIIGWHGVGQYRAVAQQLADHVREDIDRCLKTYDPSQSPECFVHAYLQKMQGNTSLTHDQMVNVCSDFFLAGMETTSTTLRWGMLLMADNQDVQEKIGREIESVLGREAFPSMADRLRLPFTSAAVHELQRMANILPLNVVHRTTTDTKVKGHSIPSDTLIMAQIFNVHRKDQLFENATQFRPERFLLSDLKTPNRDVLDRLNPFSMGKRQCAGEGLARMELFLGLTSILQKYRIKPPLNGPLDLSPIEAPILIPKTNYLQMISI